jgi:hypothetical protein
MPWLDTLEMRSDIIGRFLSQSENYTLSQSDSSVFVVKNGHDRTNERAQKQKGKFRKIH